MEKLPPGKPAGQAGMTSIFPNGLLGWIAGMIFDALDGLTFGIFNLDALADRLRGTEQKAVQAQETAMVAADEAALAAALSAANEEANAAIAWSLAEANQAIGTKADKDDIPTDVPGYVSLNPLEDVTFPRADLVKVPTIANRQTSNEAGDSYHSHSHNAEITWVAPTHQPYNGRLDIGYINTLRPRIYNTVGWIIAAQAVSNPASFHVAIYKMEKDADGFPNGRLRTIWVSPTNAAIQNTFGGNAQDIRVNLGVDIVAAPGDWYAVALLQLQDSGANVIRNLLGKNLATIPESGVHPRRPVMTLGGQSGFPTPIDPQYLDTASDSLPWMCLGQSRGLMKAFLSDLFDRPDQPGLGTNWSVYGVGMKILLHSAVCNRINRGNLTSRQEDRSAGLWSMPYNTESQYVRGRVTGFDRSNASLEDNPRAQLLLRSNSDGNVSVRLGIRWGLIEIRVYNAANPYGITRTSTTFTWLAGQLAELRVTNDPGTGHSIYTAYVDSVPRISWSDQWSENPRGSGFQRAGMETANTHRGALISSISIPSVGFADWEAGDL